jgi:hypothetical protein
LSEKQHTLKRLSAIYKGDKCAICGLEVSDDNLPAFVFHHVNPENKAMKLSILLGKGLPWSDIKKELDKCLLACANCHQILHATKRHKKILPI